MTGRLVHLTVRSFLWRLCGRARGESPSEDTRLTQEPRVVCSLRFSCGMLLVNLSDHVRVAHARLSVLGSREDPRESQRVAGVHLNRRPLLHAKDDRLQQALPL